MIHLSPALKHSKILQDEAILISIVLSKHSLPSHCIPSKCQSAGCTGHILKADLISICDTVTADPCETIYDLALSKGSYLTDLVFRGIPSFKEDPFGNDRS